jgi:hypothetical protein
MPYLQVSQDSLGTLIKRTEPIWAFQRHTDILNASMNGPIQPENFAGLSRVYIEGEVFHEQEAP